MTQNNLIRISIPSDWELHMPGAVIGRKSLVPLCALAGPGLADTNRNGRVGDLSCIACLLYAKSEEYEPDDQDARYFMPAN